MKKFTFILAIAMMALFIPVKGWGQTRSIIESNFTDKDLSVGTGELSWSADPAFSSFESSGSARGAQSSKATSTITMTSGTITGTITQVVVTASTNGNSTKMSVKVGGESFGNEVTVASGTANANTAYTFTGSKEINNGTITVTITRGAQCTFWVKSTAVTYATGGTPSPSMSVSTNSIDFGSNEINPTEPYTETFDVTFANLTENLIVTGFSGISVSPATINCNATSPQTVTVSYNPTEEGSISGNISVNSSEVTEALVAVTGSAYDPANVDTYAPYTGVITEGDYVIYANGGAMKNELTTGSTKRLAIETVTVSDGVISNPSASIIWHIAADGNYWTIYNENAQVYAAFTSSNGAATLLSSVIDNARWTITPPTSGYDYTIVNKGKTSTNLLRRNGDYGWASYTSSTGYAPTLYKKVNTNQVAMPTFTPPAGSYQQTQNVTITCETAGSTIQYKLTENGEWQTYSSAITINSTTTIWAKATKTGMDDSDVATATYTLPLSTMQEIFDAATSSNQTVFVSFNNWVVSGAAQTTAYVTDGEKGFVVTNYNGHGFHEGDILSGTAECTLNLYGGAARLQNLSSSTTGLTITENGSVSLASIELTNLAPVNTGALVHYDNLTCSVNNSNYYLSDGTTTIQVYTSLYSSLNNSLTDGKAYNITGVYTYYNAHEICPRSATDIEEVVVTTPYITIESNEFELTANEEEGYLEIEYGNFNPISFDIMYCDANGVELSEDPNWLALSIEAPAGETGDFVYYYASANDGVARDAYFMVYASLGENQGAVYSNLVHVTQAAPVVDYATLPFIFDGGKSNIGESTPGFTQNGLNSTDFGSSPKLKFDGAGDYVILKTGSAPGAIVFDIKGSGNGTWSGTFKVQTSSNGTSYSDLATYTSLSSDAQTEFFTNIDASVRYIKWIFAEKTSGFNVGLGNIIVTKAMDETIAANANVTWTEGSFTPADNHTYIVNSGATLTLSGDFHDFFDKPYYLIVKDGGQLITDYTIKATMQKDITTWTTGTTPGGWYFIASPIQGTIDPSTVGLITDNLGSTATTANATYDLYKYDATNTSTPWINYRAHTDNFFLANGAGYLYANAAGQTFEFSGEINPYSTTDNKVTLANTGWNLIGNPFSCAVTVDKAFSELNNGTVVSNQSAGSTIYPCRGIAVYGNAGDEVTFAKPVVNTPGPSNLNIVLAQQIVTRSSSNEAIIDNAVISFNESEGLPKFTLFEGNAKLYIPQGNEEYAIASSNMQGEMPVNFVATVDGEYTLTVNAEDVEMNYLHLIDNLTGADVDLLATPSYTFNTKNDDYASRFRLVFSANNANNTEIGNDDFAFISNGQIVLTEQGNARVYDITGRMISSHNNVNYIATEGMAAGVYVLQLVNDGNVKTQKIVVK